MTREEQLRFCKTCNHQTFDIKYGIICGITQEKANFEEHCEHYDVNQELVQKEEVQTREKELEAQTASKSLRVANLLLDYFFNLIFSFFGGMLLGLLMGVFYPAGLQIFETNNLLVELSLGFLFGMLYFTFFETLTGRTPAKFITRTRVVTLDGEQPGFETILKRSLCRFIPFEAFSFLGEESRGLHDSISKTRVIRTR
ncbi:RDD family protein [Robertkochia flava]|uniref:RDD family protein n=1 Tax=Robertkochia flava TaxID=3447986 RepID=UPI001CCB9113|nr:RDD family protein [Robertkochia marina]